MKEKYSFEIKFYISQIRLRYPGNSHQNNMEISEPITVASTFGKYLVSVVKNKINNNFLMGASLRTVLEAFCFY